MRELQSNYRSRNMKNSLIEKFISREVVYKELDHIRNFRNRVFHYEKVVNKDNYNVIFDEINEILKYFDDDIEKFATRLNGIQTINIK